METWKPVMPKTQRERSGGGAAGDHEQGDHERPVKERRERVEQREPADGVAHRV